MTTVFYRWFLTELIAALARLEASEATRDATVTTPTTSWQVLNAGGETTLTPGQSILSPRPRQHVVTGFVNDREVLLGDGARYAPPLMPPVPQGAVGAIDRPWLPPWPVMLPQAAGTSVAWDGPPHASVVHYPQEDGLFGHPEYPRATSESYCAEPMGAVVEVTGVYSTPTLRRCDADWRTHPEHLREARYNMRLPVQAGVDTTGRYVRIPKLPLQTFEYRPPDPGGGGGGDPT